jgi:hypothetical protein
VPHATADRAPEIIYERDAVGKARVTQVSGPVRGNQLALCISTGMEFTDDERDLILAGLFELTITYLDDADKVERCSDLATRLGGDREALFFGASLQLHAKNRPRTLSSAGSPAFTSRGWEEAQSRWWQRVGLAARNRERGHRRAWA